MNATFSLRRAILLVAVAAIITFVQHAYAQSTSAITFPIPELGNCADQAACRTYCSDPVNQSACVEFGNTHNLKRVENPTEEKRPFSGTGPGGCADQNSCRAYCEDASHAEECLSFAESRGLMKKEDVERARKFVKQTGPGGCRGEECRTYCADTAHVDECVKFAEDNNFISKEDASRAKKMMQAAQKGGPGGCRGEECRAYCTTTEHQKECYEFAKKEGFTRPEDDERFETGQKLKQALEETGGPGGCKSEEACKTYCTDSSHVEECIAFAAAKGGIPVEQAKKMLEDFSRQERGDFRGMPDREQFERGMEQRLEKFEEMQRQFMESRPSGGPEQGGFPMQGEFRDMNPNINAGGPGGCSSAEECGKYCAEHMEECAKFGGGQTPPGIMKEQGTKMFEGNQRKQPPIPRGENAPEFAPRENFQKNFQNPSGCTSPEECAKLMNSMAPEMRPQGEFPEGGMMPKPGEFTPPQQPGVFESAPQQPMPFPGTTAPDQNMQNIFPQQPPQSAVPLRMFLGGVANFFTRILQ